MPNQLDCEINSSGCTNRTCYDTMVVKYTIGALFSAVLASVLRGSLLVAELSIMVLYGGCDEWESARSMTNR